jgi:hypothetical protein
MIKCCSFSLHGSPISDNGVVRILQGLSLHPSVVSLDLGDCQLSDVSIPNIADLLPPNGAKRGAWRKGWFCYIIMSRDANRCHVNQSIFISDCTRKHNTIKNTESMQNSRKIQSRSKVELHGAVTSTFKL